MDLGFVSCSAYTSIMACGISGNWWNTRRSSITWVLADTVLFPGGGAWTSECGSVSQRKHRQSSLAGFLWCLFLAFRLGCLGGSMDLAPAQTQRRLPSPLHSSTAVREELLVITGWQRWWSEIKISNYVGLIPVACTGQLPPWEAGKEQDSTVVTDK